jgi:hypothetical protein
MLPGGSDSNIVDLFQKTLVIAWDKSIISENWVVR